MSRAIERLAGTAVVVALLAGLNGFQVNLFQLILELGVGRDVPLYPLYNLLTAGAFVLVPLGAGYVWGRAADVPANYVELLGATAVAAVLGYLSGYLLSVVPVLLVGGELLPAGAVRWLFLVLTFGVDTLALPVVALAGAAVAQFGVSVPGRSTDVASVPEERAEGTATPDGGAQDATESGEEWGRLSDDDARDP